MATTMPVDRLAEDRLFIGGEWQDAAAGGHIDTQFPATGDVIASVAEGAATDVDRAVAAARAAFRDPKWRRMDAADRGALLWRMA
ncbi:MAG TPA: aldehyde dehydrogenase family protein, partial [Longimicrobiales bacterium]|nr:aldehyde dehydrogenase family protein [Longimicrobiales bacterium]